MKSELYKTLSKPEGPLALGQAHGVPDDGVGGNRYIGGMTSIQALAWNVGTFPVMLRENPISVTHEGGKYRCTGKGRIIL